MTNNQKFTDIEKQLFTRMIDYFIREEEKELEELKLPSGNAAFIPKVEADLEAFLSIKSKIKKAFID